MNIKISDKQLEYLVDKKLLKRKIKKRHRPQWVNELMFAIVTVVVLAITGLTIDNYADLSRPCYGLFLALGSYLGTIIITEEKLTMVKLFLSVSGTIALITQVGLIALEGLQSQ